MAQVPIQTFSSEAIRKRTEEFRALCEKLSISTTSNNAVCQRLQAAERFCAAKKPFDDVDREVLVQSGEFLSLADCLEHLGERIKKTLHVKKLLSERTYANELTELETLTLVERAGFPSSFLEPDVVAEVGLNRVSFACKRIESENALIDRADEARDQISRSKIPGIAVINVSRIIQSEPKAEFQTTEKALASLVFSMEELWQRVEKRLLPNLREPLLNSYLLIGSRFCYVLRSIDHERRTKRMVSFRPTYFSFRSRKGRRNPSVITLEDAVLKLQ